MGLEPQALQHLFQPFFTQFDPSRHSSGDFGFCKRGLGLGLSIAKQFVEMHGGRIFAESVEAGGTRDHRHPAPPRPVGPTMHPVIGRVRSRPTRPAGPAPAPAEVREADLPAESRRSGRLRHPSRTTHAHRPDRRGRTRGQQAPGHAAPASRLPDRVGLLGAEALEKIRDHAPDVVFLDLMLPDMNGYEVCRSLKTPGGDQRGPGRHRHGPAHRREPDRELRGGGRRLRPQAVHARPDLRGPGTVRGLEGPARRPAARGRGRARRARRRRDRSGTWRISAACCRSAAAWSSDGIDRISAAIKALWSSVNAWSRQRRQERVATLAYSLTAGGADADSSRRGRVARRDARGRDQRPDGRTVR